MPNVFILKDHLPKIEDFTVEIEGKKYKIPNAKKLKRGDLKLLNSIESGNTDVLYDFLGKYIGQDVADELTIAELEAIYMAWSQFIKDSQGASLGES